MELKKGRSVITLSHGHPNIMLKVACDHFVTLDNQSLNIRSQPITVLHIVVGIHCAPGTLG